MHPGVRAADPAAPFALLATILERDPYLGRVLTGLIQSGTARVNMPVKALSPDGRQIEEARLTKLLAFRGLERQPVEEGSGVSCWSRPVKWVGSCERNAAQATRASSSWACETV